MFLQSFFLIVFGLVFGSFVTALSYRYPRGISNVKGRSFCDNCRKQISWFDNIPLLSFIFLGGKCRNCREKISWRYPLIEIITAIGFYLIGFNIPNLVLFLLLEIIFVIDFENQIIPDAFIFLGIVVFLLFNFSFSNIFAGFASSFFLLFIHLITKGRGMGLGDVKFAVLAGAIVGLKLFSIWLFAAFLTGAAVGIILILGKKARLKTKVAFGPFLVISIPIALIWGEKIIQLVLLH